MWLSGVWCVISCLSAARILGNRQSATSLLLIHVLSVVPPRPDCRTNAWAGEAWHAAVAHRSSGERDVGDAFSGPHPTNFSTENRRLVPQWTALPGSPGSDASRPIAFAVCACRSRPWGAQPVHAIVGVPNGPQRQHFDFKLIWVYLILWGLRLISLETGPRSRPLVQSLRIL